MPRRSRTSRRSGQMRCAASSDRRDRSRRYTFDDGVQMVVPLVGYRRVPAATDLAGVDAPGLGIGGLVSTSPVTAEHVRAIVDDLTTQARYMRLNIHPNPRVADAWEAARPAGSPKWRTLSTWMAGSTRFGMAGCD